MKIDEIFFSSEDRKQFSLDAPYGQTDVIVATSSGEKYMASFFSYKKMRDLVKANKESKEFLSGAYYWSKNMILINNCTTQNIRKVVEHLIEEGEFVRAFRKIET
jgi:hypothetical protein